MQCTLIEYGVLKHTHTHILYSYVYAHSMDSYYSVMDVKRQALRVAGMMFLFLDVI